MDQRTLMHTSDPSLQSRLPIEDILLHFEDIREKITQKSHQNLLSGPSNFGAIFPHVGMHLKALDIL